MALDATVGGTQSNSYSTVADADTFFETRIGNSTWVGSDTTTKESALVTATFQLNRLRFIGEPTDHTQYLAWPRRFVPQPDPTGVYYGQELRLRESYEKENEIPWRVLHATYEMALLLIGDPSLLGDAGLRQFKRVEVGSGSRGGIVALEINNAGLPRLMNKTIRGLIDPYTEAHSMSVPMMRAG